jgi:hypothetical protein
METESLRKVDFLLHGDDAYGLENFGAYILCQSFRSYRRMYIVICFCKPAFQNIPTKWTPM